MAQATNRAFADERRAAIMEMLEHNASVQVAEIAQTFGVSSVTARADLDALAESGKLRRTHGGAVSLHKRLTVSTQDRRINVNVAAKQAIAQSAIELVSDGDTLLVDSGTTALEFVRLLDQRDGITVITADITIADYIDESMPSVDVVMLGGALRKGHRYLYGPLTMQALQMVHADLAIMCPGAFVPGCGFTTDFPQMAETKTAMIAAARRGVALMDASKVNGRGMYRFAELTDVDTIVMDRDPDGAVATSIAEATDAALFVEARIRQEGMQLVYSEPPEPYPVWADPARLRQVFVNLFDNAIKYSEPGGTIFLTLSRTPVTVSASIRDQGRGIAPDDLEKVKQKFFKAKNSVRGSGIGLAVVDEIVHHAGEADDVRRVQADGRLIEHI